MTVSTLQLFLRSLAAGLRGADSPAASDVEGACRGLEPFAALDVSAFAGFLTKCDEYHRAGAVAPPSAVDLSALEAAFLRIGEATSQAGGDLTTAQAAAGAELNGLAAKAGLKGKLSPDPKWAEQQALARRVRAIKAAFRDLAARVTSPVAFAAADVVAEMKHLETSVSAAEWKALAKDLSLPATTKGAKGVVDVLAHLSGHRPAKPAAGKKGKAVDEAKIAEYARRLAGLFDRARTETTLPNTEINSEMALLESLSLPELLDLTTKTGVSSPGKTKKAVLDRIRGKLSAGQRVMDQTEQ